MVNCASSSLSSFAVQSFPSLTPECSGCRGRMTKCRPKISASPIVKAAKPHSTVARRPMWAQLRRLGSRCALNHSQESSHCEQSVAKKTVARKKLSDLRIHLALRSCLKELRALSVAYRPPRVSSFAPIGGRAPLLNRPKRRGCGFKSRQRHHLTEETTLLSGAARTGSLRRRKLPRCAPLDAGRSRALTGCCSRS